MRELVVLGMGTSRSQMDFKRFKDVPVWSCNNGYIQIAEVGGHLTKIFLSHGQHESPIVDKSTGKIDHWVKAYKIDQMNMLAEHGVQILNIHKIAGLKSSLYPLQRISDKFHSNGFFSDTIAYMLAYALDYSTKTVNGKLTLNPKGFEKIYIFGVDMLTKDEYELEKGGIEYWIGYARGLGIEVEICRGSALCTTCTGKPYGVRFFDPKDFDPWKMMAGDQGKDALWMGQALPSKKQIKEMQKNLKRSLK